jgi:hypothetical protein
MKILICFLVFWQPTAFSLKPGNVPELKKIRLLYHQSAASRDAARQLRELLAGMNADADPLMACYLGAAEMIQAKYALSPVSKFRSFKKGKGLIEEAIARDKDGVEMRYLRFTIQTNLLRFLSYYNEIDRDKKFLLSKISVLNDKDLKRQIISYLSDSKYCTETEKVQINKLQEM